jgi:hypothetical protein
MSRKDREEISAFVPRAGYDKVAKFAEKLGIPITDVVRRAIVGYMQQHDEEITVDDLTFGGWGGARPRPKREGQET